MSYTEDPVGKKMYILYDVQNVQNTNKTGAVNLC